MSTDKVFVDAEEEVTPRGSSRKRRSTAGNSTSTSKNLKHGKKMPIERSPDGAAGKKGPSSPHRDKGHTPLGDDPDAFWSKMGGMLGGLEDRLKRETTDVKEQLSQAIGDLGSRVERTERRLDEFAEEVNKMVDRRMAKIGGGDAYSP